MRNVAYGEPNQSNAHWVMNERLIADMKRVIGAKYLQLTNPNNEAEERLQYLTRYWPFRFAMDENKALQVEVDVELEDGTIRQERYRPLDISSMVLRKLREGAEEYLGLEPGAIKRAVIAHPAYFGVVQKEETKEAARLAGLEVMDEMLISEPMAATLSYRERRRDMEGGGNYRTLVFDLGAGTFDITVIEVRGS